MRGFELSNFQKVNSAKCVPYFREMKTVCSLLCQLRQQTFPQFNLQGN